MKKLLTVLAAACAAILFAGEINVKDFGAAGDSKKDDTAAIAAALKAAAKKIRDQYNPQTVYFPSGVYLVKGTLKVDRVSLRGNNAVIVQLDPEATTFDYINFWHASVKGRAKHTFYH